MEYYARLRRSSRPPCHPTRDLYEEVKGGYNRLKTYPIPWRKENLLLESMREMKFGDPFSTPLPRSTPRSTPAKGSEFIPSSRSCVRGDTPGEVGSPSLESYQKPLTDIDSQTNMDSHFREDRNLAV